nr:hypothetical protein Itr_chr05CG14070 [Ipomoea trifida]
MPYSPESSVRLLLRREGGWKPELSAEDSADRPFCAAARDVARRKRPKPPMLWSSAGRRRTPETSGPLRCSAAVHGRGRRKRRVRWPTPLLCFFELLPGEGRHAVDHARSQSRSSGRTSLSMVAPSLPRVATAEQRKLHRRRRRLPLTTIVIVYWRRLLEYSRRRRKMKIHGCCSRGRHTTLSLPPTAASPLQKRGDAGNGSRRTLSFFFPSRLLYLRNVPSSPTTTVMMEFGDGTQQRRSREEVVSHHPAASVNFGVPVAVFTAIGVDEGDRRQGNDDGVSPSFRCTPLSSASARSSRRRLLLQRQRQRHGSAVRSSPFGHAVAASGGRRRFSPSPPFPSVRPSGSSSGRRRRTSHPRGISPFRQKLAVVVFVPDSSSGPLFLVDAKDEGNNDLAGQSYNAPDAAVKHRPNHRQGPLPSEDASSVLPMPYSPESSVRLLLRREGGWKPELSAEDSADRPFCAAARDVARRKRPKPPMLWSSAGRRRTPETSGPLRCSAAVHGRGRRKRRVRWPTPLLCFFELLPGRGTSRRRPCEESVEKFRPDVFEHGGAFTTESRHRRTEKAASSSSPVAR